MTAKTIAQLSNEELINAFDHNVTTLTFIANGMSRRSEKAVSKEYDALKAELLKRLENHNN